MYSTIDCCANAVSHRAIIATTGWNKTKDRTPIQWLELSDCFFFQWLFQPIQGAGLLFSCVIIFHGRISWTSDQLVARPLPEHRITQAHIKHPCHTWDSSPRSHRSSERKQFMPQTTRLLWPAYDSDAMINREWTWAETCNKQTNYSWFPPQFIRNETSSHLRREFWILILCDRLRERCRRRMWSSTIYKKWTCALCALIVSFNDFDSTPEVISWRMRWEDGHECWVDNVEAPSSGSPDTAMRNCWHVWMQDEDSAVLKW
jgi:hypothetical protein